MRLLHVVPTYLPATRYGGPIYSVHGLCAALAKRGHDVHVFTTNVDGASDTAVALERVVEVDGVKVSYFPSRMLRRLYFSPPMARALKRHIAGFDLVHLHSVFLWPTWAAAGAAKSAGIPYVVSPRGMLVKDLIRARSRYLKQAWLMLIERSNLAYAAAIHVTSAVEASQLYELGLVRNARILEIPNGVAVPSTRMLARVSNRPYVLMLGRITWKKRIDIALQALAISQGVRLIIAGNDDERLTGMLLDRAKELGIADRVEFVGHVQGEQKSRLLRNALALLMPSISENFGNSALEALAEGTPAIVTAQVGAADVVKSSNAGFVVTPQATDFADAIRQLQDDPKLRNAMGERGRQAVAESYTWPAIAARMEHEYARLLKHDESGAWSHQDAVCSTRSRH